MPATKSSSSATHRTYTFGEFTLDVDRGALLSAGADMKLRPKSFEVLSYLVERHGRLVSRDELLDAIWGQTVVTEDAVTQCLIDIRRAIGDQSQKMIRTVPRRGYIFDLPVTQDGGPATTLDATNGTTFASRLPRWWFGVALIVIIGTAAVWWVYVNRSVPVPVTAEPAHMAAPYSIAVLPFVNMSDDAGNEYFSDGLSEELLNLLAIIPELRVAARTSSFSYKGKDTKIQKIGAELNVAHVLEGSVRKSGNQIRITAQLVNSGDGFHVWSQTYNRTLSDIFVMQDEIAASVVEALKVSLLGAIPTHQKTDPEVYSLYLQGKYFNDQRDEESLQRALTALKQALAIDPNYAPALVAINITYTYLIYRGELSQVDGYRLARAAVDRALAVDSNMGSAWSSLAYLKSAFERDMAGAQDAIDRAMELDPANESVVGVGAYLAVTLGQFPRAIVLLEQALVLDPLNLAHLHQLARVYTRTGRFDDAIQTLERLLALSPDYPDGAGLLARAYLLKGDPKRALTELEKNPTDAFYGFAKARILFSLGNEVQSQALIKALLVGPAKKFPGAMAFVYAWRGENDAAFEWLELAFQQGDLSRSFNHLLGNGFMRGLEVDPRYPIFLEKIGLLEAWKAMPPEYRRPSKSQN